MLSAVVCHEPRNSHTRSIRLIQADCGEPTSGLEPLTCSLRVIGHALQGCAGGCKSPISKGVSLLWVAECCTVLRSRWYQIGIKRPPLMHRERYLTSRLSILWTFLEYEGTPHFWIATLTGYRLWADMPPK